MHLILYDGLCGLCNRFNRFVLARDSDAHFQFASLQSPLGRSLADRFGFDPTAPEAVLVVTNHELESARLRMKADAALFVLEQLPWPWRSAGVLRVLPRGVLDWGYDRIAHNRYRFFGRYDVCPLPEPRYRERFLD